MESIKQSILCVDDDADNLEILQTFFEMAGFKVSGCDSLEKCLTEIKQNNFSAIILDYRFNEETSLEACREIRSLKPLIPIIYCSAEGRKTEIEKALEAGGDEYFVKPVDFDKLTQTVRQLISSRAKHDQPQNNYDNCYV